MDNKKKMILINKPKFEIGICKSGSMYWRPQWSGFNDNFHRLENGKDFKYMNTWSYFVMTTVQLFWLRFIFYIQIKPERISSEHPQKYVRFEDTHLTLMDDVKLGKWSDPD